jgi:hypothetical protein
MSKEKQSCYVRLRNGQLVNRNLYVQYFDNGKPFLAHDGRGIGGVFYEFATDYDMMVKKFVKGQSKKRRINEIKDDYLNFLENKTLGTKVYTKDFDSDDWLEFTWDGEIFKCGRHMYIVFDDILNMPVSFQKPEGKTIISDWTRDGYHWNDSTKDWIKNS